MSSLGDSTKSFIDGVEGVLEYVGIDIDDLARNSTFEECCYLLWYDRLPTAAELDSFEAEIRSHYGLSDHIKAMVKATPKEASPMHVLRTLVSALGNEDPECNDQEIGAEERKAIRILAKTPAMIAAFERHRRGESLVDPDPGLNIATNFLLMLNGEMPGEQTARALDVCLILHADHASMLRPSRPWLRLERRVTCTRHLWQPLVRFVAHFMVVPMSGSCSCSRNRWPRQVESFVKGRLERKEKVPGFGHRVYKAYDPRAKYLKTFAHTIAEETGNLDLYEISNTI